MKTKTKIQTFNFWKENKKSGFFQLTENELTSEFEKWLPTKDKEWLEYYSISDCVNIFVMEALTAIGNTDDDFAEYQIMCELLKPVRRKFLEQMS